MAKLCSVLAATAVYYWFFTMSLHCLHGVAGSVQVPAMFVFGDSLVDNGNNNNLMSLAKANYWPYGIDFYQGPSGRFCNGKTVVDLLCEMLSLPYLPAYGDNNPRKEILSGVNYASAAGGILEETGQQLGDRFSLSQQVLNFESDLDDLRNQMSPRNLTKHLATSIVVMVLGSNDYVNNYLIPSMYTSRFEYNPEDYADLLINHYTRQILALFSLGLRKFLLAGIGPVGCSPSQLAINQVPPGHCANNVNEIVGPFNEKLRLLIDQLNGNHPEAVIVYGNTYGALGDILNGPATYGFNVTDQACCGFGRNQGEMTCVPQSIPCGNRKEYIFWDAFHPTEAVNAILAQRVFSGPPSDCYPINVQQMALI
ncbi:hypothetical protein ACLOJK_016897 [Asimina triloba]